MDDTPEILKKPFLHSSNFLGLEIPLVSLEVGVVSVIDQERLKGSKLTVQGHTKNPRWVYGPRYVSDYRTLPVPSEDHIQNDCCTSRECSELI